MLIPWQLFFIMDSVNANTLTEVTTVPTNKKLIFTDPDTNEGGIITMENLTKQVLQNLTSQQFALDAGKMTIPAALNALNSESFNNGYNLNLTDWNSISAPGIYSGNGSDAKNSPSYSEGIWINAIAFASNGNKNYITIIAFYGLHISVKTKAKETWSGWELLV